MDGGVATSAGSWLGGLATAPGGESRCHGDGLSEQHDWGKHQRRDRPGQPEPPMTRPLRKQVGTNKCGAGFLSRTQSDSELASPAAGQPEGDRASCRRCRVLIGLSYVMTWQTASVLHGAAAAASAGHAYAAMPDRSACDCRPSVKTPREAALAESVSVLRDRSDTLTGRCTSD